MSDTKKWTDIRNGELWIDIGYLRQHNDDVFKIASYNQDIYYGLSYGYKIKDWHIAQYLSKHTNRTTEGWNQFMRDHLFRYRETMLIQKLGYMHLEFILYY